MLQPKKPNFDKLLKDLYKKQQSLEKIDEENQFKSDYIPQSLKYQKQRKNLDNKKTELKTDSSTTKDRVFNKNIYDQKEWNDKKWGYAEDAASIAEFGNFIPHPVAQSVGKAGAITSAALSARKAKLAYDNEDYVNMGLNLGMMGVSAGLGSKTLSRSTPKLSKLDSFEKAIAPKSFESNIINGIEIGRNKINVPSYINILNQKPGQSTGNLLLNRSAIGAVGVDLNTDFSTEQNRNTQNAMGGNINNMRIYAQGGNLTQFNEGGTHEQSPIGGVQPKKSNISNKSKKKLFQLQGETNLVQKDNIPNTKRDLSLMLAEYNNAKKDEQELRTTGQIKNPNSIQYKRNVRTQPNIKQDNISAEQRNAPLNPLQRPLIYLANPEKVLGDLGVPNMETSELDRQKINANKFNPYQSKTDRFINNAKIGLGYVPKAALNTALAATFMPEGTGALGLVNEALNPLAGIKTSIPDSMKQGLNSQGFLDMFKSKSKLEPKFNSEINWGKWNKEIPENTQLMKEYNTIEQQAKVNNTWMKNPDGSAFQGTPEQFVQQNSENFKKSFTEGFDKTYRGSWSQKSYKGRLNKDSTKGAVFAGDEESIKKSYAPEKVFKNASEKYRRGLHELYYPKSENTIIFDAQNSNWRNINKELLPQNIQDINNKLKVSTDDVAKYIEKNNIDYAKIKNVDDAGLIKEEMIFNHKPNNYLKSVWGNNGMFDMTNSNIYKSIVPIAGASYLATQGQEEPKKLQQGGYINQNTNMNRYAQGGDLTQFNEGGLHSQNPLGGVPIGNNNSVEQGETKQGNFIYSDRIVLDENIVSQYNLPKSLIGKSVADATKLIDNKFKGRNDKISQSTKNGMLSKIAEAQEAMKPQEPEMEQAQEGMEQQISPEMMGDPSQMAWGGFADSTIGQGFGEDATASQKSASLGAGLGVATSALDLGKVAFGKPAQDTSGLTASAPVNGGNIIAGSAVKGASAGMAFGPLGAGIGAVVGLGAGLLGAGKAKKAALENSNNYAARQNIQYSDQYAMGGDLLESIDPKKSLQQLKSVTNIDTTLTNDNLAFNTKKIVKYQPGVTHGTKGTSGFYIYSKDPVQGGFNPEKDREFINQENMIDLQRTPQWKEYMKNQSLRPKQFANGGKMNKMEDGGDYYKKNNPYFTTNPGPIIMGPNPVPAQSILETSGLKPVGTTTPYTIGTQPRIDMSNLGMKATPGPSNLDMLKYNANKVGTAINNNAGNIARYAPVAANALQLAQLKKPQGERLDRLSNRYKPEYVDEAALQNIADQTMNNSVNAIGQSGASQGQLRSSILGSQLQRTKAISDSYSQAAAQNRATNDRAQSFNADIDRVNLQQSTLEKDNNARDQAAYRNAKREYITGIGEGIGDIGKEQVYKKIIAKTTGYKWDGEYVKSPDGTVVTDPLTGKPMTQDKLKELQSTKDKKALGGYLIKNKVK